AWPTNDRATSTRRVILRKGLSVSARARQELKFSKRIDKYTITESTSHVQNRSPEVTTHFDRTSGSAARTRARPGSTTAADDGTQQLTERRLSGVPRRAR